MNYILRANPRYHNNVPKVHANEILQEWHNSEGYIENMLSQNFPRL